VRVVPAVARDERAAAASELPFSAEDRDENRDGGAVCDELM